MSQSDAFDRVLASLNDAALDDTLWPSTAALIDEACGLTGSALVVGAHDPNAARVYFARICYRGERRRDVENEYFNVYYPMDERIPRIRALPDSELAHATDLFTDSELRNSVTYNEGLRRHGGQNALHVRLDGPDGSQVVWVIVDSTDPDGWGSAQVEMIRRVLPHLRQFVRVRHAVFKAGALGTADTRFLGSTRVGVVYVDWRGRILDTNDRGLAILLRGDGLFDQDGFLCAQFPADNGRLRKLLSDALPPFGKAALSGSMTVRRLPGMPRLVLHVNPVPPNHGGDGNGPVAALILIAEPGNVPDIDPDLVASALDLTAAESRVAVMLAEGKDVRDVAAAVGRQVNTVQFHVKQIHHKLGISRRGELVRLVLSLVGGSDFPR
ncbi:MAG: LuxR C-terminal-related transcriptional regulator [Candidatus Tectomicrobia bacterium]|nr:LuxR C-terminal-related transcriptional regulator [Candidatus Tectomicrobia bacterium]